MSDHYWLKELNLSVSDLTSHDPTASGVSMTTVSSAESSTSSAKA